MPARRLTDFDNSTLAITEMMRQVSGVLARARRTRSAESDTSFLSSRLPRAASMSLPAPQNTCHARACHFAGSQICLSAMERPPHDNILQDYKLLPPAAFSPSYTASDWRLYGEANRWAL